MFLSNRKKRKTIKRDSHNNVFHSFTSKGSAACTNRVSKSRLKKKSRRKMAKNPEHSPGVVK